MIEPQTGYSWNYLAIWIQTVTILVSLGIILWKGGRWSATITGQIKSLCGNLGNLKQDMASAFEKEQVIHDELLSGHKTHSIRLQEQGERLAGLEAVTNTK